MVHSRQRRWACQTVQPKASSPRSVMREGLCSNMTHTSEGCNMPMTSFETQRSPVRATRSSAQFRHCDGDSPREFADGIVPRLLANLLLHASGDGALRARVGHDQSPLVLPQASNRPCQAFGGERCTMHHYAERPFSSGVSSGRMARPSLYVSAIV